METKRIAIIGFGPRGIGALERLSAHYKDADSSTIEVTIFEPDTSLGSGSAYDPGQAEYLLMNFPAAKIDMRWGSVAPRSSPEISSFCEWVGAEPNSASGWYPPRALVGRYLAATAEKIIGSAPFQVTVVAQPVVECELASTEWLIQTTSGLGRFDEVLLAVGHAPGQSLAASLADVREGTPVDIRGFGLTAIDLILAITEGRGRRFESTIFPHTRHGRPMLVKPELASSPLSQSVAIGAIEARRQKLAALPPGCGVGSLGGILAELAGKLLGSKEATDAAAEWIDSASLDRLPAPADPAGMLARSMEIATGRSDPDLDWALGLAWRSIYPAVVRRFSHGGLPADDYDSFRSLAAELERLAFGPPPMNGARMLALIEAGVLDLSELDRPVGEPSRVQLDTVSAPPGLQQHQRPLPQLVAEGSVRVPPGVRGIEITREARCVGADGTVTPGLAACGRMTEDWVIGNDTLDRSLHPEIDRWAASVCNSARTALVETIAP